MVNACCIGHPCDDCAICRSGVCCMTVQAAPQPCALHVAICQEIGAADSPGLGQLLRVELVISGAAEPRATLPQGQASVSVFTEVVEEEEVVHAPRPS